MFSYNCDLIPEGSWYEISEEGACSGYPECDNVQWSYDERTLCASCLKTSLCASEVQYAETKSCVKYSEAPASLDIVNCDGFLMDRDACNENIWPGLEDLDCLTWYTLPTNGANPVFDALCPTGEEGLAASSRILDWAVAGPVKNCGGILTKDECENLPDLWPVLSSCSDIAWATNGVLTANCLDNTGTLHATSLGGLQSGDLVTNCNGTLSLVADCDDQPYTCVDAVTDDAVIDTWAPPGIPGAYAMCVDTITARGMIDGEDTLDDVILERPACRPRSL